MLNDTDLIRLNESYMQSTGATRTSEDFQKIVEWAENINLDDELQEALYSLVMKGLAAISWDNETDQAMFEATEKGRSHPQMYNGEMHD